MRQAEYSTALVDLDAILDTRLTVLGQLRPDLPWTSLKHYHERKIDIFDTVSFSEFREAYHKRDKRALREAKPTPVCFLVRDFVTATNEIKQNGPTEYIPKIVLNTYPYVLEDSEINVLIAALRQIVGKDCEITTTSLSMEDATPRLLKEYFSTWFTYEATAWLEAQSLKTGFKQGACPEVTMISPLIYFKENPNYPLEPLTMLQDTAAMLIDLKMISIEMFSFLKPLL